MRVIETAMLKAIRNGKEFSRGNTTVECPSSYHWQVKLHGNLIAEGVRSDDKTKTKKLGITLAGWNTRTTRSRINAILYEFSNDVWDNGIVQVFNRKHEPYIYSRVIGERPLDSKEWIYFPSKDYV